MAHDTLVIGGTPIHPGERQRVFIRLPQLYDFTTMTMPVDVIRGKEDGPRLFVSAAIHGDEINGVEVIRQLLRSAFINHIHGTLMAVPIVNVFGYNDKSRYLPDRRDLNRSFPGHPRGPLASQLAHIFMQEIVMKATHGIDLHTGALHRTNYPQIRAYLKDKDTHNIATAFQAPVIIDAQLRDGSLREAARRLHMPMLLFEGGEALRYDPYAIDVALKGIRNVMYVIGMLPQKIQKPSHHRDTFFTALSSHWVRAPHSGSLQSHVKAGDRVVKKQILGMMSDPFGDNHARIESPLDGVIIGATTIPLLNAGDATFHIATLEDYEALKEYDTLADSQYGPIHQLT
ncbi:MAG: succinylglutamate desuccinylase/aspartoacylase family protein [Alphaproteobacteria bacterium GM7ARS4]|nr:succinylglutamate desuccinylase/aspartoacylase family protein [Alphaproteobacteria bacterium GM7ARS4]